MTKTKTVAVKKVKPTPEPVAELDKKYVVDVLGGELITSHSGRAFLGFSLSGMSVGDWDRFDLSINNFVLLSNVILDKNEFCENLRKLSLKNFDDNEVDTFANLKAKRRSIETADYSSEFDNYFRNLEDAKIENAEQILDILISEYNAGIDLILDNDRIICKELATNRQLYNFIAKHLVDQLNICTLFNRDMFYDQLSYDNYSESHKTFDQPHNMVEFITSQLIMMLSISTFPNNVTV